MWPALTTAEGLSAWFGEQATIDLRPGGAASMTFAGGMTVEMRVERVEEPKVFAYTWRLPDLPDDDPRRTYVEFTLEPDGDGTVLRVDETGFAQLPVDHRRRDLRLAQRRVVAGAGRAGGPPRWPLTSRPWPSRSSSPSPTRPAAPSSPPWPPTARPPSPTWPRTLPITRQAIAKHLALMADAGLVTPEPGERRRVRYRLRSAPVQLAQQFLAALAHQWDDRLDALQRYLTAE